MALMSARASSSAMLWLAMGSLMAITTTTVQAKVCETSVENGMDNYGPGVSLDAVEASTPFEIGAYNAIIAFDATHCIKMCCEQDECKLAVFNEVEAVCYLKGREAEDAANRVAAEGVSTYTIERRTGDASPVDLEPSECRNKRGVAFGFQDTDDLYTLKDGMSWWYDWSPGALADGVFDASLAQGSEYIPMIWGEGDLTEERVRHLAWIGDSAPYLLGFNEPNFKAPQSELTAAEAAGLWSQVKEQAEKFDMDLVSPAINFCYGECIEEDPVAWMDDFMAECDNIEGGCGLKYLAVHSYACEVKYLNKHMHSYTKYGLPIWLTEFACGFESNEMTAEGQAEYLSGALTYLELNPHVYRYAWFTAISNESDGIDDSINLLDSSTKELTVVGDVFVSQHAHLQHCNAEEATSSVTESVSETDSETMNSDTESEPEEEEPASETPAPVTAAGGNGDSEEEEGPGLEVSASGGAVDASEAGLDVDPDAEVIMNAVITNIGGSGYYDNVVDMTDGADMSCPSFEDACIKEEVCVSGGLAPFDEVSVAFRGPLNLHNIAWYEGTADETLERTSLWSRGSTSENLTFMTNRGGVSGCSGVWSICGGNSQSFADASGTWCASEPTGFDGNLPDDNEVNIMTGWECASESQCGFYRDVGMRGWTGGADGTKVMIFEVDMPHCEEETCTWDRPAIWALNARVIRTAQYGCNCRGMGGNGGCGEFDILEGVIGNDFSDMLFTQVYDFKGAGSPGTMKYFQRPSEKTTYAAIFRGGDDSYLQVAQLDSWEFSALTLMPAKLDEMKGSEDETHEIYDVDSRVATNGCETTPSPSPQSDNVEEELMLAEGYTYVGCFGDMSKMKSRDMALLSKREFSGNKPSMCSRRCAKEAGATFFGLQNGGLCWCGGMGETGPGSYGEADNCDKACPGDESVVCGGKKASSVYVIPVDHTYIGCFEDKQGDRDMFLVPKVVSDYMTPAACAVYCSTVENAAYFGVQDTRKCFCGDSYGKHGVSSACDKPCSGDSDQVCGSKNVNSVYTLLPEDETSPAVEVGEENDLQKVCTEDGGYCGCYADISTGSLLKGIDILDSNLTRSSCQELCVDEGYPFYGLEWSIRCTCGGKETSNDKFIEGVAEFKLNEITEACDMPCAGDETETCGGQEAFEIWET